MPSRFGWVWMEITGWPENIDPAGMNAPQVFLEVFLF